VNHAISDAAGQHRPMREEKRRERIVEPEHESQPAPVVGVRGHQMQAQA
jgi:hypothetical protein